MMWGVEKESSVAKMNTFRFSSMGKGGLPIEEEWNCVCEEGALRRGVGIIPYRNKQGIALLLADTEGVESIFPVQENDGTYPEDVGGMYATKGDGYLYHVASDGVLTKKNILGENVTHSCLRDNEGRIYNLFSGSLAAVCETGGTVTAVASGNIKGSCVCGGRYFLAYAGGKVVYSAPYAPTAFAGASNEGGELYIPTDGGETVGIASENGKAYLFTERKIYRWTVAADPADFRLEEVRYAGGRICEGSILATGNGILFLAENGCYRAQEKTAEQICAHLTIRPKRGQRCATATCEDLAMIEYKEEVTVGVTTSKRVAICSEGKTGFFTDPYGKAGGNGLCCINGLVYRFAREGAGVSYRYLPYAKTGWLDFGAPKWKKLKGLRLFGRGSAKVEIRTKEGGREYLLAFVDGVAETRLIERGKAFALTVFPMADSLVTGVEIDYFGG